MSETQGRPTEASDGTEPESQLRCIGRGREFQEDWTVDDLRHCSEQHRRAGIGRVPETSFGQRWQLVRLNEPGTSYAIKPEIASDVRLPLSEPPS